MKSIVVSSMMRVGLSTLVLKFPIPHWPDWLCPKTIN